MESERKKTQLEYPASHSVDTDWFAVDRDGRLASISSGEEGLLPADIDKSNDDHVIVDDAMILNSEPICKGCRRFIISDEHLSLLMSPHNLRDTFDDDKDTNQWASETYLYRNVIQLADNVRFDDLFIWKERINEDSTLIFELTEDHKYIYCCSIEFKNGALNKDIVAGNIIEGIYYFDERILYTSYSPNDFDITAILERVDDEIRDTIRFKLPKNFHEIKELDLSFAESDEFNLGDYTGVYFADLEGEDEDSLIWPNYDGLSGEDLVKELFIAIEQLRTRSVWCLLDKYDVPSNAVNPSTGETALETIMKLWDIHSKIEQRHGHPLSCQRILKMIQLKEKQRVSDQTSGN